LVRPSSITIPLPFHLASDSNRWDHQLVLHPHPLPLHLLFGHQTILRLPLRYRKSISDTYHSIWLTPNCILQGIKRKKPEANEEQKELFVFSHLPPRKALKLKNDTPSPSDSEPEQPARKGRPGRRPGSSNKVLTPHFTPPNRPRILTYHSFPIRRPRELARTRRRKPSIVCVASRMTSKYS
jgi:hypothetical protein